MTSSIPTASARSSPIRFGTCTAKRVPLSLVKPETSSAASANCGTLTGWKKPVTSMRRRPDRTRDSTNDRLFSVARTFDWLWSPSRGPTSCTVTDIGTEPIEKLAQLASVPVMLAPRSRTRVSSRQPSVGARQRRLRAPDLRRSCGSAPGEEELAGKARVRQVGEVGFHLGPHALVQR